MIKLSQFLNETKCTPKTYTRFKSLMIFNMSYVIITQFQIVLKKEYCDIKI